MNREIYSINLSIQAKYGNIRTRKNSAFETFHPANNFYLHSKGLNGNSCRDILWIKYLIASILKLFFQILRFIYKYKSRGMKLSKKLIFFEMKVFRYCDII